MKKLERPGASMSLIYILTEFFNGLKSWMLIIKDPIIKDQMANLGSLSVCKFGDYLALVLIAAHTANNVDLVVNLRTRVMKVKHKKMLFGSP